MMAKTDRQLLTEIHDRVVQPVLFPQLEIEPGQSIFQTGTMCYSFIGLTNPLSNMLGVEWKAFDGVSLTYRFRYNDLAPSRDMFIQLCKVKGAA
jgi:hypothetical protein